MKIIAPNYYQKFSCIAERCRHNCCIGWEIDIDEDTYEYYQSIDGKFGQRLKNDIVSNDECSCFRLDGKGRCAFLNKDNRCDIILNLGENSLCQICDDHPRFRNFYDNSTEIGLGLCCEEAGRIILGQKERFELIVSEKNSEKQSEDEFLIEKENILYELQDKNYSLEEKVTSILNQSCIEFKKKDFTEWVEFFISLERLDDSWTNLLHDLKATDFDYVILSPELDEIFEKLLIYFLYRHLDEMNKWKICFSVFSTYFIAQICKYHIGKFGEIQLEEIVEYARMYSSEIEYSDENIERIIDEL